MKYVLPDSRDGVRSIQYCLSRSIVCLGLLGPLIVQSISPAIAGTVGSISGTVTDRANNAPIADVTVVVSAPTGSYKAVTNAHGFYFITGITPDTTAVSFEAKGFGREVATGITVFADQTVTLDQQMSKANLKTIAKTESRSIGGAFQPNRTADTVTVTARQIEDIQGTDLNFGLNSLASSLPGVVEQHSLVPLNLNGVAVARANASFIVNPNQPQLSIRGGRLNAVSYNLEGVSANDAWSNQIANGSSLPTIAIQEFQVTPGLEDVRFPTVAPDRSMSLPSAVPTRMAQP